MPTAEYLKIKDKDIPVNIKSYKNSKTVKIYFKSNILNVTKPKRLPVNIVFKMIKENEEDIYNKYLKIISSEFDSVKQWKTGEKIYYNGNEYKILREYINTMNVSVRIEKDAKTMRIILPKIITQEEIKPYVDKAIKQLFKCNTEAMINEKLPYWSKITGIKYNDVKVRDATSRYGSCMPSKKNLYFSSRLIMLPEDKVDAVIVHELCHMKYKYHNEQFYNLVEQYIPNYSEIDRWLKDNGKLIMF